jgi:chorismate synthase
MTFNTFGHMFRFTTWGESHGEAIGCVVDGCPPLIPLSEKDIQPWLDRRRPAQNKFTSQRKERDVVKILSGVFEGKTTGTPISLIIYNEDAKSKDYDDIKDKYRPGHADYTYQMKYGIRDWRGSGRASARETAMRVAAGAIARKILNFSSWPELRSNSKAIQNGTKLDRPRIASGNSGDDGGITITGAMIQMGEDMGIEKWDSKQITQNPFWCPDKDAVERWAEYLDGIRKEGSSVGAVIQVVAEGVPAGLGAPIYKKLDADIATAMMSINAVKGVEIGAGFAAAALRGEDNADRMRMKGRKVEFLSNNAGGILGGISTGQPIVVRFAVKPTSSILQEVETVDRAGKNTTIRTKGRHDPCVGIRAVPIGEAMLACVLADHLLMQRALKG